MNLWGLTKLWKSQETALEWGEQMAGVLAAERLEVHIARPIDSSQVDDFTSDGERIVTLKAVGKDWLNRLAKL